jgi:hypothetical protein
MTFKLSTPLAAFALLMSYGFAQVQTTPAQKSSAAATPPPSGAFIQAEIKNVEGLLPKIVDKGAAWFLLARRYAQLGDQQKAVAMLGKCISLDEGFNPDGVEGFRALAANPGFRDLLEQARHRYPPVHRARVAFTIQEKDLFPEGLAVDSARDTFYMGSEYRRKIIKITKSGKVSDFVRPGLYDLMPVGGVKVDLADHSVWAATDPGEKHRSELVHFDQRGELLGRFPIGGTGPHDLNDLVIRNPTEIFTTDTFANQAYRLDPEAHAFTPLSVPRPLLDPNGITLSGDNNVLYIADMLGVIAVDLRNSAAREVAPGRNNTLAGIDGLYWYKGSLLGVQYGTGTYRVARWQLSPDGLRVASTHVLERGTQLVGDPTTGAILNGKFYFMANTGIYNLKDDRIVDEKKLEPVQVAVVELK